MEAIYQTTEKERTFFIVDLSRLKQEGDTLVNAMVVYTPEADLKKAQYEQRCSQLVGLTLCTMNFTGKYPDYLRLRSTGFAIQALGQHYIMGLQGRHDEPREGAVECLKTIHNCFRFYYHSPAAVMKTSQGDWEIFTRYMASIFTLILQHMSGDKHSVQAMFNMLPYTDPTAWGMDGPRVFLLASRVLRACQQHYSIIGGCITHTKEALSTSQILPPVSKIVCSQFPPMLTEKLVLAGGQGIELNSKSIVEDNITPDKVWVIEVYLTREEEEMADDQRKDLSALQSTYSSLDANPRLASSTMSWHFQSPGPKSGRQRGQWRKKNSPHKQMSPSLALLSRSTSPSKKPPEDHMYAEVQEVGLNAPIASSTPNPRALPKRGSISSEDAVQLDLREGIAIYNPNPKNKSILKKAPTHGKSHEGAAKKNTLAYRPLPPIPNEEESTDFNPRVKRINIYADDCLDDLAPPINATNDFHTPPSQPHLMAMAAEGGGVQPAEHHYSDDEATESRPSTGSSEGFATPSPTLPGDHFSQQKKISAGSGPLALSSDTDRSSLFQSARETSLPLTREEGQGLETSSTLTRGEDHPRELPPELPPKPPHLRHSNSPHRQPAVKSTANDHSRPKLPPKMPAALPAGSSRSPPPPPPAPVNRTDTLPGTLRNWRFKPQPSSDSDDDPDFVSSTELQHMLLENTHKLKYSKVPKSVSEDQVEGEVDTGAAGSSSQPGKDSAAQEGPADDTVENGELVPTEEHAVKESIVQASTRPTAALVNGDLPRQRSESPLPVATEKKDLTEPDLSEHRDGLIVGSTESQQTLSAEASVNGPTETSLVMPGEGENNEYDDIITLQSQIIANKEPEHNKEPSTTNGIPEPAISQVESDNVETEAKGEEVQKTELENIPENGMIEIEPAQPEVVKQTATNGGTSVDGPEGQPDNATGDNTTDSPTELDKGTSVDGPEFEIARSGSLLSSGKTLVNEAAEGLGPVNDVEESILSEMDARYDANESISAGLMTPVEMTLNEATLNVSKLEDSGDYSSLPEDEGEEEVGLDVQDKLGRAATLRTRAGSWVHKSLKRQPATPQLEKKCLYVQRYMNTVITLLADEGLHQEQEVLHALWQSLQTQLYELDAGLKKGDEMEQRFLGHKPHNNIAIYSATERKCEALPNTAVYHVRHAFRRAHQEYLRDPSVLQIALSKEHVRMLSQRVLDREVYFNPGRMGHVDALSILSVVEKYAKVKQGPWQEKLMLIT